MSKIISHSEYLQLVGLCTLATKHNEALVDIEAAARAITGDEQHGHTSDGIYCDEGAAYIIERLEITVAKEVPDE